MLTTRPQQGFPLVIGVTLASVCFVFLYVFLGFFGFTSQVNSCGHGGTVSSPNHTFSLGKLEQAVNQYFVHILTLVTDNKPFLNDSADGMRMTIEIIS